MNQGKNAEVREMTLREAQNEFYRHHGFPADGGSTTESWSLFGCRDLKVHLPNFAWRRKAIPFHDLHHLITGFEFSPTGEFQIAAWEFAAGRYPNFRTTLFCLPLVSMGAVITPKKTLAAFVLGLRSKTLYTANLSQLLERTVNDVRSEILPRTQVIPEWRDYRRYALLVTASGLLTLSPVLLALAAYFYGVK